MPLLSGLTSDPPTFLQPSRGEERHIKKSIRVVHPREEKQRVPRQSRLYPSTGFPGFNHGYRGVAPPARARATLLLLLLMYPLLSTISRALAVYNGRFRWYHLPLLRPGPPRAALLGHYLYHHYRPDSPVHPLLDELNLHNEFHNFVSPGLFRHQLLYTPTAR